MKLLVISETDPCKFVSCLTNKKQPVKICRFDAVNAAMDSCQADLILLDCENNAKSGLTKLKEIKKKHPAIPIIFITTESSEAIILKAFRYGARDYYKKPINIALLKKNIAILLMITKKSKESRKPFFVCADNTTPSPYAHLDTIIPETILRAITYIEDNFAKEIHLDTISLAAGMSKYHFSRLFRKYLRTSPMQFLSFTRMERARKILKCTSHSITHIANEVGFNDLSNFNKTFKKKYGISPSTYRKNFITQNPPKSHSHS